MTQKNHFKPPWVDQIAPDGSYRSLFKWGNPAGFKHPNQGMVALLKEVFELGDQDLAQPDNIGMEPFDFQPPFELDQEHLNALISIIGQENVDVSAYSRARCSFGGSMVDSFRLRQHIIENIPDAVLAPRSVEDIQAILAYCLANKISLYVFGAGSGVTRGTEAVCRGVSLDMSKHMNRCLGFSEINQTITVQAGMFGPVLEDLLNHAPEKFKASRSYTCGNFPQSFQYSSVGGWVVTRGAGQNSTYYGKIEDMVLSQTYVTPSGLLETPAYPRCATGPDFNHIMMGSDGCFGILTSVTLRIFRYMPENTRRFSFLFHDWDSAISAAREIMQSQFGFPSVFRLSDPEETDVAMRTYHIHDSPADTLLKTLGYQPGKRCLLFGSSDGDASFTRLVARKVTTIARRHHAFPLTPFQVTRTWEKSRFTDPYLCEDLMDFGIWIDTLECAVTWEQVPSVYAQVRTFVKSHAHTICMTHLSHCYPQGTNLYFIYITRIQNLQEYLTLQYGILDAIQKSGASMSHHHGIGKHLAPWLEDQIGTACMEIVRSLKRHFDPEGILNPGGTLGLDMDTVQKSKRWGIESKE